MHIVITDVFSFIVLYLISFVLCLYDESFFSPILFLGKLFFSYIMFWFDLSRFLVFHFAR